MNQAQAYPLQWPRSRPRKPASVRKRARFPFASLTVRAIPAVTRGATGRLLKSPLQAHPCGIDGLPQRGGGGDQPIGLSTYATSCFIKVLCDAPLGIIKSGCGSIQVHRLQNSYQFCKLAGEQCKREFGGMDVGSHIAALSKSHILVLSSSLVSLNSSHSDHEQLSDYGFRSFFRHPLFDSFSSGFVTNEVKRVESALSGYLGHQLGVPFERLTEQFRLELGSSVRHRAFLMAHHAYEHRLATSLRQAATQHHSNTKCENPRAVTHCGHRRQQPAGLHPGANCRYASTLRPHRSVLGGRADLDERVNRHG